MRKIFIYIRFSLKALLKHPDVNTLKAIFKYVRPWYRFNDRTINSVNEKIPWLCFSAIDQIKKVIHRDMIIFEYGSGGSTLFWASRVKEMVSVEHDRIWYGKMRTELSNRNITNIKYILSEAEPDNEFNGKSFGNPADYISKHENFIEKKFEAYVKQIDQYPDEYFHIVVVDGRARPSCISHALKKVKKNGYLIVDNSERDYYLAAFGFMKKNWKRNTFYGPVPYSLSFSETSIFKRIK
ncbi:MAG: hypothetical protein M3O67_10470 [Bacteroidota bacterium]|nr:hypothetical protein [Bacteroidota bacterium]